MVLSGQTIRRECLNNGMIIPFNERIVDTKSGMTWGLGIAGYDIRVRENLVIYSGGFTLASSIEEFKIPNDILGTVNDKSSWARKGIMVQNTVLEAGWTGFLTLEITNHSERDILIRAESPIAQILFYRIDEPVEFPYKGKYQNQLPRPIEAIHEK